jgi:cytoskeletal protein CcmA (bactofilin family)
MDGSRSGSEAVIGRTTRVRGRVSGDGDLVIEGTVEGDIVLGGDLTIAEGGRATSSIQADAVTLRGELDGDVRARGVVRIEAGARVRGDVLGEAVALEEGAELVGRLDAAFELPAELGGATGGRRR